MFDVIGKKKWFFLFSGLLVVPGLIFIILTPLTNGAEGLKFSIDYTGGTVWELKFQDPNVTTADVRGVLVAQGVPNPVVDQVNNGYIRIRTSAASLASIQPSPTPLPSESASGSPGASASAGASGSPAASASSGSSASPAPSGSPAPSTGPSASAAAAGSPAPGGSPAASGSPVPSASGSAAPSPSPSVTPSPSPSGPTLPTSGSLADAAAALQSKFGPIASTQRLTTVGAIVSADLIQSALILILVGSIGILIWITVRFSDVKMGVTALAALVHDVIVVVGTFAVLGTLFGVEIDALFVTAVLTVIGFSVHDTIVVYDRIRENKARHAGEPFDRIVNHSILQTFGRSINTSFTVVLTLLSLLLFGGSAIRFFVLALLIGIVSGTYSSIFNASPLLVVWHDWEQRRRDRDAAAARTPRRANA